MAVGQWNGSDGSFPVNSLRTSIYLQISLSSLLSSDRSGAQSRCIILTVVHKVATETGPPGEVSGVTVVMTPFH